MTTAESLVNYVRVRDVAKELIDMGSSATPLGWARRRRCLSTGKETAPATTNTSRTRSRSTNPSTRSAAPGCASCHAARSYPCAAFKRGGGTRTRFLGDDGTARTWVVHRQGARPRSTAPHYLSARRLTARPWRRLASPRLAELRKQPRPSPPKKKSLRGTVGVRISTLQSRARTPTTPVARRQ
ncbi:hypothetical protein K438DRAFT_1944837 [Mycena galopus ATCC 62051]|nr:hypothetical protein K438DRAFT_1944837 [Mycena galopus ATCC 62051]